MTIILTSFVILKVHNSEKSQAAELTEQTTIKIEQDKIEPDFLIYEMNYDYSSTNDPIIILSTHQIKNIELSFLEEQLGKENVSITENDQQLILNLKQLKKSKGSFKLKKLGSDPLLVTIRNAKQEVIYQSTITDKKAESNTEIIPPAEESEIDVTKDPAATESDPNNEQDNSAQPEITRDPDWNRGWNEKSKLIVARGIDKKLDSGRTATPVQYFGALNYALEGITLKDSVGGRPLSPGLVIIPGPGEGTGRKNNLTAANSAVIISRESGKYNWTNTQVDNNRDYRRNYYLNYTFGDGFLYKPGLFNDGKEKIYRGSQRNFITTNLFDYYSPTGDISKPRIYGPDVEEERKVYGLDEKNVHYSIKNDKLYRDGNPNNQDEDNVVKTFMQRMVFRQVMNNSVVQVTITMKFDNNNASIITTEFKNIGSTYLDNFQGYTFRDITFIRDHRRDRSKQDNIIRSLGNHVGAYASRNDVYDSRIEFKLSGYPDSPYAWSARGTRSAFYSASDKDHFPWNTKGIQNQYDDAFKNIYDRADQENEPSFGEPFMDYATDSGLSMHTKNQPLAPGQQVSMTYATGIIQYDEAPILDMTTSNTKNNPYQVKPNENEIELDGTWLYDRKNKVNVKYFVQEINTEKDDKKDVTKDILNKGVSITNGFQTQTVADMHNRVKHPWTTKIPLSKLGSGLQKISVMAYDEEKRTSVTKTYYIQIPERSDAQDLGILVTSPVAYTTENNPYDPRQDQQHVNKLTIGGYSNDVSHNHKIEYKLDNGERRTVDVHENMKDKDNATWSLRDLDLTHLNSNIENHKITFFLTNKNGEEAKDNFHFKYIMNASEQEPSGTFRILAPKDIDFGTANLSGNSSKILTPKK